WRDAYEITFSLCINTAPKPLFEASQYTIKSSLPSGLAIFENLSMNLREGDLRSCLGGLIFKVYGLSFVPRDLSQDEGDLRILQFDPGFTRFDETLTRRFDILTSGLFTRVGDLTSLKRRFEVEYSVSHAYANVDSFKRCGTSYTFDVGYKVLRDLILHRSSINNGASLSNKFKGFYFTFKFGISGLLHHVVTTDSQQSTSYIIVADAAQDMDVGLGGS
nr:hypothetical protein [Tanacetum cinerariifolium]GEX37655.1 hypothetical protein [Tanacetum cinerariifolium]